VNSFRELRIIPSIKSRRDWMGGKEGVEESGIMLAGVGKLVHPENRG